MNDCWPGNRQSRLTKFSDFPKVTWLLIGGREIPTQVVYKASSADLSLPAEFS